MLLQARKGDRESLAKLSCVRSWAVPGTAADAQSRDAEECTRLIPEAMTRSTIAGTPGETGTPARGVSRIARMRRST